MMLDQPLHADLVAVENFLVGLQHDDDVAIGREPLLLVANQVGDERGRHKFVVACPAAIEVAIAFQQLERLDRPVLAFGLDHVEMREQQNRSARAGPPQPRDEVALALRRLEHMNVGGCKLRSE